MKEVVAGIDIGGTKIAVALADSDGQRLSHFRFPTQVKLGAHCILDNTITEIERLLTEAEGRLAAVGVGCGGPLSRARGMILSPPNLPGWDEFPIVEILKKRFGVPVILDNDANAAALGEHSYGAGRGFNNLVYITISTGIGGGVIVNREIVHGIGDGTGEVGHISVQTEGGVSCACGARGCLEALCSGTNIARRARESLAQQEGTQSLMRESANETDGITAKTVLDAARQGDFLAKEIWHDTIRYLAIGINNIIVTLAPDAVILGGGVSAAAGEQMLLEPLRRELRARVKIVPIEQIQILQAALGGESGIYGALILGRRAAAAAAAAA